MGKLGKNARKFAKKHLKAVIEKRHKYKHMRDASKRKKARFLQAGTDKGTLGNTRKETENQSSKIELENVNGDEMMNVDFMEDTSFEEDNSIGSASSGSDGIPSEDENDYADITVGEFEDDDSEEEDDSGNALQGQNKTLQSEVEKHREQLERLKEKDPELVKFLKEHNKELLQFKFEDDVDTEEDNDSGGEDVFEPGRLEESTRKGMKPPPRKVLTAAVVDAWCQAIRDKQSVGALHCLLRAFRAACHYGDEDRYESSNLGIMTSNAFNKVMIFVLVEVDSLFKKLLGISRSGRKKETILELQDTAQWRNFRFLIKSYLSNVLYILNQMTDNQMISFTLQHLRSSVIFLAAFPIYLRKFLKVALHFWVQGEGSFSVVSFLFIRDMVVQLGSDCLNYCFKGIYKVFVANCKFVNAANLQQIRFLENCVVQLYGLDLANAYPHALLSIQRLEMVLRNALTMKTKEAFKKAYGWQYMNCLSLWVNFLCTHTDSDGLQPLTYPIAQIIIGVARLVPTARYFPFRLQCTKMLNRLSTSRGIFIPVASLLLDMLKELGRLPAGGVGKSVDFSTTLKVSKPMLKTRTFQEACVYSIIEQLAEHLAQWSYHIAFPELAFIPIVHLRHFHKKTNIDRCRRQVKQLIDQVERNVEYVGRKREDVSFSPKDQASVSSFLQAEKESGASPLSQYHVNLQKKAEHRKASLQKSRDVAARKSGNPGKSKSHVAAAVEEDSVVEVTDFSSVEFDDRNSKEEHYRNDQLPSERPECKKQKCKN